MDLDELRAFLAVGQHGSFQAAARALDWPRANVRRRVDDLEGRLGSVLFVRSRRGAVLTDAGAGLVGAAERLLRESDAFVSAARDVKGEPGGDARVVIPVGMPPALVAMAIAALVDQFPDLRPLVTVDRDPVGAADLHADIVFHFGDERVAPEWETFPVMDLRIRAIASAAYLARAGTPTRLRDLADHKILGWQRAVSPGSVWRCSDGTSVQVAPVLVTNDIYLLHHLVALGAGIAMVPDNVRPAPQIPGAIVTVMPDVLCWSASFVVSMPRPLAKLRRLKVLFEVARAHLQPLSE